LNVGKVPFTPLDVGKVPFTPLDVGNSGSRDKYGTKVTKVVCDAQKRRLTSTGIPRYRLLLALLRNECQRAKE
jgi:hypothetical protein